MSPDQIYCVLDCETRSKRDLRKTGAYEYAQEAELLCLAWRIGTLEDFRKGRTQTKIWSPFIPSGYGELKRALLDLSIILVAHNAFFEQVIIRFVLSKLIHEPYLKEIPPERWLCTASQARALALPGKLEQACAALKLKAQKDMEGHRLMLKMSKPRKPTKNNPKIWHAKVSDLKRLMVYCCKDVDAEIELLLNTKPLSSYERKVWLLDQKINWRGIRVDRPLVKRVLAFISEESDRFVSETHRITKGKIKSTKQVAATLAWLKSQGASLPNLRAGTVKEALESGLAKGPARELLEIRQAASKSSTAKCEAFEKRSRTDGRVRDNLVYHVASTGRWGGAGLQPQNFPRGTIGNTDIAASILLEQDTTLEQIRFLYGKPMDVFSSVLRAMIISSPGNRLIGGDYAGIELRVLFWAAKHEAGLKSIREGANLYCDLAFEVYKRKIDKKEDPLEYLLGKEGILGSGYQLGADGFQRNCKSKHGIDVSDEISAKIIQTYRSKHYPVVQMWYNLERAAMAAVKHPGKRYSVNRTVWWVEDDYLFCELPSKRRLAFRGPRIKNTTMPWGEVKPALWHWGLDATKQWVFTPTYGGKLTENVVQAIARDIMVNGMFQIKDAGYPIVFTVHDEVRTDTPKNHGSLKDFSKRMASLPDWGKGCPITVEPDEGERYRK